MWIGKTGSHVAATIESDNARSKPKNENLPTISKKNTTMKKPLFLVYVIWSLAARLGTAIAVQNEFGLERKVDMMGPGCDAVEWTVDREALTWTLAVRSAPMSDYVGIGISENSGMKGADLMIVKRTQDGSFVVDDTFSRDFVQPEKDIMQNVELLHAYEDDAGRIRALLSRPLDTCDFDDLKIQMTQQHLVCASGRIDEDGTIQYHGGTTGSVAVNLVVDDTIKSERFVLPQDSSPQQVSSGVMYHGDRSGGSATLPVDVRINNITIDERTSTTSVCSYISLPHDLKVRGLEALWGEDVTIRDEPQPSFVKKQTLYHCKFLDPSMFEAGNAFSCFDTIIPCTPVLAHGRSGLLQFPTSLHLPVENGLYLLKVDVDKGRDSLVKNFAAGLRFWVQSDSFSQTTAVQSIAMVGQLPSILIPATQEQEYTLEFQISPEATNAALRSEGLSLVGGYVRMNRAGLRSQVKLIRNGVHIRDLINTKSYDDSRQNIVQDEWRILPGDAIVVSCTYRPDPGKDIVGGLTNSDETCSFISWATASQAFEIAVGYMVKKGTLYKNSYIGNATVDVLFVDYSKAQYLPEQDIIGLDQHETNFCELAFRDMVAFPKIRFSSPEVSAQVFLIGGFLFCYFASFWKPFHQIADERKKRNTIIALVQLVFSSVALPFVLKSLVEVWSASQYQDATDPHAIFTARAFITAQAVLYLAELYYRIKPRWEIILHHILTPTIIIFIMYTMDRTFALNVGIRVGLILTLMAVTEQPFYLTLLLKNLGYAKTIWWPKLCFFSGVAFVVCKLVSISLTVTVLVQSATGRDSSWSFRSYSFQEWFRGPNVSEEAFTAVLSIVLFLLLLVQLFIGKVMISLALKYGYSCKPAFSSNDDQTDEDQRDSDSDLRYSDSDVNGSDSGDALVRSKRAYI